MANVIKRVKEKLEDAWVWVGAVIALVFWIKVFRKDKNGE